MKPIVISSHEGRNTSLASSRIAQLLRCPKTTVGMRPELSNYDTVILVMPIMGDEELHPAMEAWLLDLPIRDKNYCLCELGNFLGLPYEGCSKIVQYFLGQLNWTLLSSQSIDSLPDLDMVALKGWIDDLRTL